MSKVPMLEKFAAQSLVEHDGELIFSKEKFAELIVRECMKVSRSADGLDATHEAWYLIQEHFGLGLSTEDKKTLIKELLGVKE